MSLERKVRLKYKKNYSSFMITGLLHLINNEDLSYEQRRSSLAYLMFLKLKIDEVKTKVRRCADGRK